MKMISLLIGLSMIALMGCNKSNSDTVSLISDFPNTIGTKYIYSVTDSTSNKNFIVSVNIVGKSTVGAKSVMVWTYSYPTYTDTNYVFSTADSSVFYDKTKTAIANVYHFPLTVGARWQNKFGADTSKVTNKLLLSVKAGTFNNTYLIQDKAHSPNYNLNRSQWFVPQVGLVKLNIKEINLGAITAQSWELIQYQVP